MAREIGIEIEIERVIKVKEVGAKEEITTITHRPLSKSLEVLTRTLNSEGKVIKNNIDVIDSFNYERLFDEYTVIMPTEKEIWNAIDSVRLEQHQTVR